MTTLTPTKSPATYRSSSPVNWHAAAALLRSEARLLGRNPGVLVWTAILPVAAAIVLGSIGAVNRPSADLGGLSFFQAYQPILVFFAITLLAVQALPDVLTRYRELGVLKRLRTTPVSPAMLLAAQLTISLAASMVCVTAIVVVPALVGAPWPHNSAGFVISYLLGAWALLGLGMVIASLFRNAKVAAGFGTALFFALQFFAGLWWQRPSMPGWLRHISDFTPSGAAVQALMDSSLGLWPRAPHLIVLVAWGGLATWFASRFFSWE